MTNQATIQQLLLPIRTSQEMKSFLLSQDFKEVTSTLWEVPDSEEGLVVKQEVERFYNEKI